MLQLLGAPVPRGLREAVSEQIVALCPQGAAIVERQPCSAAPPTSTCRQPHLARGFLLLDAEPGSAAGRAWRSIGRPYDAARAAERGGFAPARADRPEAAAALAGPPGPRPPALFARAAGERAAGGPRHRPARLHRAQALARGPSRTMWPTCSGN
ncbi:hypothetical protein [Streptomyces sp. NPDC018711]|uniref:hypothetical protein n=1 Tax=Streptomyces sp. NPDC018711 TaxID=3365052 RepID=UPI00379A7970